MGHAKYPSLGIKYTLGSNPRSCDRNKIYCSLSRQPVCLTDLTEREIMKNSKDSKKSVPYLFELTHRVRRPSFQRVPHLKIKNTNVYIDVN